MQQNHKSETMLTEQIQRFTSLKHGRTHRYGRPWCSKVWWVDVTFCLTSPAGDFMTLAGSFFYSSWKRSCPESGDKGTSPLSKGSWRRAFSTARRLMSEEEWRMGVGTRRLWFCESEKRSKLGSFLFNGFSQRGRIFRSKWESLHRGWMCWIMACWACQETRLPVFNQWPCVVTCSRPSV